MKDTKSLQSCMQDGSQAFAQGRILDGIAALRMLLPDCAAETILCAEAESLEKNYYYMLSFLRKGGDDQQRSEVLARIQRQGIALLVQAGRAIRISLKLDVYSNTLSDSARLDKASLLARWNGLLTPEETSEVQDDLFDFLWTSPLWTAQDTASWYDFLLRQRDMVQQHLMGAVFLSIWEYYDAEKMQLLGLLADSECHRTHITACCYLLLLRIRHRDVVSLMPSLPRSLLSQKGRKLIAEVQSELLLMLVSEKDMEKEMREAENLTKGIIEGLGSAIPEGEEDKAGAFLRFLKSKGKALAGTVGDVISLRGRYLKNRLQRGLDINLAKIPLLHKCAYMHRVAHWFMPFDKTHPLFQSVMIDEEGNEKQNLSRLVDLVLDCDVDKMATLYLVASDGDFSKAVQQLDEQELPGMHEATVPGYTVRFIMQDLYRFFGHSRLHKQLLNPFRVNQTLFDIPALAGLFSSRDTIRCSGLLYELGRDSQALAALDGIIQSEGASASALLLKGMVLKRQKKVPEAIHCVQGAEMLEPDNTDILRFLGECYAQQKRPVEELECLKRLARLLPDDREIRRLIPITMCEAGQKEEALQLFFRLDYESTEDDEDYGTILSLIADTALSLGKLDIAERYTQKILERSDGKEETALLRMGHIRLIGGDMKSAIGHYEQYVNICCEQGGVDVDTALKRFSGCKEMLVSAGISEVDILLIHDTLQAASEGSLHP